MCELCMGMSNFFFCFLLLVNVKILGFIKLFILSYILNVRIIYHEIFM